MKNHVPKVAIFVGDFPVLSETFVITQAAALIDADIDLQIFANALDLRGISHPEVARTKLIARTRFANNSLAYCLSRKLQRPYRVHRWLEEYDLRHALKSCAPFDIILCHFGPNGDRALKLRDAGFIRGPIWTVFHGFDLSVGAMGSENHPYKRLFKSGELFLPISNNWREKLIALGCPASRIQVHHMGVECSAIPFCIRKTATKNPVEIFSVCRLVEKKGIEFAIRSLAIVREKNSSLLWHYKIVGEGPLAISLKQLIASLDLQDHVEMLGALPNHVVREQLEKADIFLLPSVRAANGDMEGIPVAIMEAMASGASIATTFHSGIPELVENGISGMLSVERDIEGLADNLLALILSPPLRKRLAAAARLKVQAEFDNAHLNSQLVEMISISKAHSY